MSLAPINAQGGFRLYSRSFGYVHDPAAHQRVIGRHVYIFRTLPDRIDVWRSDMADHQGGYRWTLVHTYPTTPKPCGYCYSATGHHVQCPQF